MCQAEVSWNRSSTNNNNNNANTGTEIRSRESKFKIRLNNHRYFRVPEKRSTKALAAYVWHLEEYKMPFNVKWKLLETCELHRNENKIYKLRMAEIYIIPKYSMEPGGLRKSRNRTCGNLSAYSKILTSKHENLVLNEGI